MNSIGFSAASRRRPRILVVDDDPVSLQMLASLFESDHDVVTAGSGAEAMACCEAVAPDLVLLDIMMPGLDGLDTCRRLKAQATTRDLPILFVTSQESPLEETAALDAGAVDFITKPVNPAVVRARVRTHLALVHQARALESMAYLDGLTLVPNRRRLDETLVQEWRRCRRDQVPLALVMADLDHFKAYNDTYGHAQGDACLRAVAAALANQLKRPHDLVARFGGEEFVCLLPDTPLEGAMALAEDLRVAVRALGIRHEGNPPGVVTLSLGVASLVPDQEGDPGHLLQGADRQLYLAKRSGRDQVAGGNG